METEEAATVTRKEVFFKVSGFEGDLRRERARGFWDTCEEKEREEKEAAREEREAAVAIFSSPAVAEERDMKIRGELKQVAGDVKIRR